MEKNRTHTNDIAITWHVVPMVGNIPSKGTYSNSKRPNYLARDML